MFCIEIKDLKFIYNQGTSIENTILQNINLNIYQGEFFALVGGTGSGKSTLVQLLNGMLKPSAGCIYVMDIDVTKRKYKNILWQNLGTVFQFPERQILKSNVYDEIAFGPRNQGYSENNIKNKVYCAMSAVGITQENINACTDKLNESALRKTAIAGILASEVPVIVLDEPGTGLTPLEKQQVLDNLKNLQIREGYTVLLVTHCMDDVVNYAERVAIINNGEIIFCGDIEDINSDKNLLKQASLKEPYAVELTGKLKKDGVNLPGEILTCNELFEVLSDLLKNRYSKGTG